MQYSTLEAYRYEVLIDSAVLLNHESAANHYYIKANNVLQKLSNDLVFSEYNKTEFYTNVYLPKSQEAEQYIDEGNKLLETESVFVNNFYAAQSKLTNQSMVVWYVNIFVWGITSVGLGIFVFVISEHFQLKIPKIKLKKTPKKPVRRRRK